MDNDDYALKIDDQVQKFLELKHKLTFFLITAAIGSLGFTLAFSIERFGKISESLIQSLALYIGTLTALLTVGAALGSLYCEIKSYQYHLRYRYQRKSWDQLSDIEKNRWNRLNNFASKILIAAFILLVFSVVTQSGVFVFDLHYKETAMHHYGEDSTKVTAVELGFNVVFQNKETGQEIKMYIPRSGVLEDPSKGLTLQTVRDVADAVAHVLREQLQ